MPRTIKIILAVVAIAVLLPVASFFIMRPINTAVNNVGNFINQKVDDVTNYDTIKKVEDTCRAMISSYETDRLTYEQYKDSDSEEKRSWAEQAKMRANKTANSYNNFILKNSFVWRDNIPSDIKTQLETIE